MLTVKPTIDAFLKAGSRAELRAMVAASAMEFSLPQVQRIIAHAGSLEAPAVGLRLAIVHTYTSDLLDPWLAFEATLQGLDLQTYHAPYGVTFQEAHAGSDLVGHRPDMTVLMLQREDLHPDLALPLARLSPSDQNDLRREVLRGLVSLVSQFREHPVGQIILTLLPSLSAPGLGVFDAQSERSESAWWAKLKAEIGTAFRESIPSSLFFDLDESLLRIGRESFFDLRFWYSAQFPFTARAAREVSRKIIGLGAALKFPKAKVIALDADNTLWGGVIGEDGMAGIALGPDYPGRAFVDFQRRLLDFQQRGFLLALCSKNNPADLDQVLREHPHQVLRDRHFAARRVNWESKPDNLVSLAKELNLGLDSIIFVDDSSHECAAVRYALPLVEVIQTPARAVDLPLCLEQVPRLEVFSLTDEDLAKTEMYAQERRRRTLLETSERTGAGIGQYLESLAMKMTISLDCGDHLTRLSQLTQKTNQFNLTTRRYDEHRMREFISGDRWLVADFSLADVFGDSGIVGLAIVALREDRRAELDTFLMSCRVIGREAEGAFLHILLKLLAEKGIREVVAEFAPTAKNGLAKDFLPEQGFVPSEDGRYVWNLEQKQPRPESAFPVAIEMAV
jgi:FkbH-like protein